MIFSVKSISHGRSDAPKNPYPPLLPFSPLDGLEPNRGKSSKREEREKKERRGDGEVALTPNSLLSSKDEQSSFLEYLVVGGVRTPSREESFSRVVPMYRWNRSQPRGQTISRSAASAR